jgi:hypothetical protein
MPGKKARGTGRGRREGRGRGCVEDEGLDGCRWREEGMGCRCEVSRACCIKARVLGRSSGEEGREERRSLVGFDRAGARDQIPRLVFFPALAWLGSPKREEEAR